MAKIITLCGSTKFKKEFEYWNKKLTLEESALIFSVSCFWHADNLDLTIDEKEMLDEIHRKKISLSDEIFVINVGGYIGFSTAKEIAYAQTLRKKIRYLEPKPSVEEKEVDINCQIRNMARNYGIMVHSIDVHSRNEYYETLILNCSYFNGSPLLDNSKMLLNSQICNNFLNIAQVIIL